MRTLMIRHTVRITLCTLILSGFNSLTEMHFVNEANAACSDTAVPGVNWNNCRKRNLIMEGFDFTGSNFTRSDLSASDLRKTTLSNSNFEKTNLVRASLAGAIAKNVNFQGVIASRTIFSNADFTNSNFSKAEISRANFSNSILENVDMSKGDFSRVDFSNANLTNTNFSFSNLARANFEGVKQDGTFKFKGAYTYRTNFGGVDLSSAKSMEQWQIDLSCGNDDTILPEGLEKPANWPCRYESDS